MSPREAIQFAREHDARVVDVKFTDLFGMWHHFSMPIEALTEEVFEEGIGFDGSSIRGFQTINLSDMLLIPDPETVFMDPFTEVPTVSFICNVVDPITRERYTRDPRYVAQKAEAYLRASGIADTAYFGPEVEFYIFNDVRYGQGAHYGYYYIDSDEAEWNTGREEKPNLGHKMRLKGGYFPVPPADTLQDLRTEMMLTLMECGVQVEVQHHEVGAAGQAEIDIRYDTLTRTADKVMLYKYVVKNVAARNGYTVTFMPKPVFQDNGSGMHSTRACGKRARTSSMMNGAMRCCPRPRSITSAAFSITRLRCWRSLPPARTLIAAWCRATKRPLTWSTVSATGARVSVSPPIRPARKRGVSSFVPPTPRAIPIWRSPRC
jgi:glutamine synthetase